jgi:4-alpha-glucanotransferase
MLDLESERAKAYIVGEDLGTVEESARKKLARSRVLSYRLLWFEKDPPVKYPKLALAECLNVFRTQFITRLTPRLETLAYARLGHKTSRAMGASCVRVSTGGALDLIEAPV